MSQKGFANWSLLRRLFAKPGFAPAASCLQDASPHDAPLAAALLDRLVVIEAFALARYAEHGLPTRRGHYMYDPGLEAWTFIGETLDAGDRWAIALEAGSLTGRRFGALDDIGALMSNGSSDLIDASRALSACRQLRTALENPSIGPNVLAIELAFELGAYGSRVETHMAGMRRRPRKRSQKASDRVRAVSPKPLEP